MDIDEIVPLPRPLLPTENCTAAKICLKGKSVDVVVLPETFAFEATRISGWLVTSSGTV